MPCHCDVHHINDLPHHIINRPSYRQSDSNPYSWPLQLALIHSPSHHAAPDLLHLLPHLKTEVLPWLHEQLSVSKKRNLRMPILRPDHLVNIIHIVRNWKNG